MRTCKRVLIFITTAAALLTIPYFSFGQDSMYIDNSGNVGIGTSAPAHNLHIARDAPASATLGGAPAVLMLEQSNNLDWSGGEAAAEILFKKGGDIVGAIRSEHTRVGAGVPHSYEDAGLTFYVAPSGETPIAFEAMRIDKNGRVGIGETSPASRLVVIGDIHLTGKLTSDGGYDPPYVLYDFESRQSVVDRIKEEVPPSKLRGAAMFFNGETSRMEIFLPLKGEFRDLSGNLLAVVRPVTESFETEDRYYLDKKTGDVKKYKVQKEPAEKYKLRANHVLDSRSGKFYRVSTVIGDKNRLSTVKTEVSREQAVEMTEEGVAEPSGMK